MKKKIETNKKVIDKKVKQTSNPKKVLKQKKLALKKNRNFNQIAAEQFQVVSDLTSDFIFSVIINKDNSKTLEWITKGFKKHIGVEFHNLLKPNAWKKYIHPDDHEIISRINNSIYADKKITAEYRFIKKDGNISWHSAAFIPLYDKKLKRVVKYYGASKDITERKNIELELIALNSRLEERIEEKTSQLESAIKNLKDEITIRTAAENQVRESNKIISESAKNLDKKLRESEYKHLWNVYENSEIPAVTIAQNGLCLNYNKAAEKLLGYTHEELPNVESWLNKLITKDSYRNVVRKTTYKALSEQKSFYSYEVVIQNKNGEEKNLILQISTINHEGAPIGIQLGQFTDITERRNSEKAFTKAYEMYKVLFNVFPLGITVSDKTGKIIDSNRAAEAILGLSNAEQKSRSIDSRNWKIIRPDGTEMPADEYASVRALKEGKLVSNIEMGVYKSPKDIAWISVSAAPLPLSAGGGVIVAYGDISDKINSDKLLKESEERYRMLVDNSPLALFVHKNGKILFANDSCIKMFHAGDSSQVIGHNLYDFMHPDYKNISNIKSSTLRNNQSNSFELKYFCLDNQLIDVEARAIPIKYNNEKAVLVAAIDVTEKNAALRKIKENDYQLRFLVEKSPIVIFRIDKNGLFTLSEGKGLAKLGLAPGQVVGLSAYDMYKDYPEILKAINSALNGTSTRDTLHINNIVFDIYYTPIFDKDGNVEAIGGIAYDVTEHSDYESQLLKAAKQWQTTFDSVSDAVWLVDLNSVIVRANKTSEKILGKPLDQIIGKHCYEVVHGDSRPIENCPVQRMKISLQHEFITYQAQDKWYQAFEDPIFDDAGKLTGAVHSITDITEQYTIQQKLEKSEALYRLISENSVDVIWMLDIKTFSFTYVSPSVYKLSGYTPDEVYKQSIREILTHESYEYVTNTLKFRLGELLSGNSTNIHNTDEVYQIHKDGRIIPTEVSTTLLFDSNGNPEVILGVTRNISDRKEAQKKIIDSELRYRKIVEMSPEAIFIHKEGEFLFANKATLDLVGASSFDELKNKKLTDYLHPNSIEILLDRIDFLLNGITEHVPYDEYTIIRNDGTLCYIESTSSIIDFHGQRALQSVARDITQRKESERALKESQDRFRQVVEYSPSAIVVHQNAKIAFANPAAVKLIGANTMDELLNKNVLDFVHPEYKNFAIERVKTAAQTMQPLEPAEVQIIKMDGKVLDVEIVSVPFYMNNNVAHQLIIRDITEDKAKTEELRKLYTAVEQNASSVIITNINGEIEYANPKFLEITGYELNEVLGNNPSMFNSGKHNKEYSKKLWETILAGNEWRGEFQNKKKNGDLYWEFTTISPLKNKHGKITHFVATKDDITERKKFADEMMIVKDETEHAFKVKSSLLANMSHELRTPLNGIIGFTQLLQDYIGDEDAQVMLNKIIRSGQRLSTTFTEILNLSELEMGEIEFKNVKLDLSLFCQEMKLLFADKAESKNLTFDLDIPETPVYTYSDDHWLSHIVNHLIDNALKFTFNGGVTIKLNSPVIKNNIEYAAINIIDTGIGVKEEEKNYLFKEFRQISEGTSRDFEGLGLGLHLSKRMAANINCHTTFVSEFGKGSTFTLWIPLLNEVPIEKLINEPVFINETVHRNIDLKDIKILLVEDNPLNIEVVEKFLSKTGTITPVRTGEDAVHAAKKSLYDLLLVDISLGHGIDGIEVLKQIRLLDDYNNIPALALTGYVSDTNKKRFKAAGFNGFLGKPFEKKDLLSYINRIFKDPKV